jgi:hypothetical protein
MLEHKSRLASALGGGIEMPPVAGISFVSPEVLRGTTGADSGEPSELLVAAVNDLSLDFGFVPADVDWAEEAVSGLSRSGRGALWVVDGPLWPALLGRGVSEGLKATAWDPGSLDAALDGLTMQAQDLIMKGAGIGADTVVVADDVAGSTGPLVSPDYFNEHLVERYALLVATAASAGLRTVFHSDGDTRVFLAGIARAGFIGLHGGGGLDQESFERLLLATREQGLTLLGGLDSARLGEGPDAAMRAGTRAGMLASAGGLIVTDDGGMTTVEEIEAFTPALGFAGVG